MRIVKDCEGGGGGGGGTVVLMDTYGRLEVTIEAVS
jgi:hypothetical protein